MTSIEMRCVFSGLADEAHSYSKMTSQGWQRNPASPYGKAEGNIPNMLNRYKLVVPLAFVLCTAASAGPLTYVIAVNYDNFTGEFGMIDPTTGSFTQIGPITSDPLGGLVQGPNGNLLGITFSGDLDLVNPATGAISVIGATGLGDLAGITGELNGTVYATDLYNNLYTVNTTTGAASLIGPTGIPICPSLISPVEVSDETLFTYGGKLYATFDGIDLETLALVDSPELYQIDPATGVATLVAPTTLGLDAAVLLNGTLYSFAYGFTGPNTVLSLNPANGNTALVADYSLNGFTINGATAVATPEPASFALAGIGIAALVACGRRRRSA